MGRGWCPSLLVWLCVGIFFCLCPGEQRCLRLYERLTHLGCTLFQTPTASSRLCQLLPGEHRGGPDQNATLLAAPGLPTAFSRPRNACSPLNLSVSLAPERETSVLPCVLRQAAWPQCGGGGRCWVGTGSPVPSIKRLFSLKRSIRDKGWTPDAMCSEEGRPSTRAEPRTWHMGLMAGSCPQPPPCSMWRWTGHPGCPIEEGRAGVPTATV